MHAPHHATCISHQPPPWLSLDSRMVPLAAQAAAARSRGAVVRCLRVAVLGYLLLGAIIKRNGGLHCRRRDFLVHARGKKRQILPYRRAIRCAKRWRGQGTRPATAATGDITGGHRGGLVVISSLGRCCDSGTVSVNTYSLESTSMHHCRVSVYMY